MKISTNFHLLAYNQLPPHKRQPVRIAIMNSFLQLSGLLNDFFNWRTEVAMLINVNSQVKVLEGFLRVKYNNRRIVIKLHEDGLLKIGLLNEGDTHILPLATDGYVSVPLSGEAVGSFDDADFMVLIPGDIPVDEIKSEVEKYKLAEKTYKIIQQ